MYPYKNIRNIQKYIERQRLEQQRLEQQRLEQQQRLFESCNAIKSHGEFENTLIGNRLEWLLLSQAFLFIALVVNLSGIFPLCKIQDQTPIKLECVQFNELWSNISQAIKIIHDYSLFYPIIPILGLMISICVMISTWGAILRLMNYNVREQIIINSLSTDCYRLSARSKTNIPHYLGLVSPIFIPTSFVVVWFFIIFYDFLLLLDSNEVLIILSFIAAIGLSMFAVSFISMKDEFNNINSVNIRNVKICAPIIINAIPLALLIILMIVFALMPVILQSYKIFIVSIILFFCFFIIFMRTSIASRDHY